MIISGGSRRGAKWFAGHVMRTDAGQQVRLAEARGLAGYNIPGWFRQMEAVSFGTRCDNYFYHANINPREDERLTEPQWQEAIDTLEQNLGLEGHARFVVEHEKEGRVHRHVFWSRIDPDTMTAVSDSKTYGIHMRTADELEKAFGHEPTPRGRGPEGRNPDNWEVFRAQKSRLDPYDIKAELTELWQQADTGKAFAAALEEHGYILAKGDRRDFVVVDQAGDDHSLARRISGARAADIRARLKDIDRDALPSVEEARAMARERPDREDAAPVGVEPDKLAPDHGAANIPAREKPEHEPTTFDRLAAELAKDAPASLDTPEHSAFERIAQKLIEHSQEIGAAMEPALSAFEKFVEARKDVMRAAGGDEDALRIAGLEWRADRIPPAPDSLSTNREPTAFERYTHAMKEAARDNGGEPYTGNPTSFWRRSVALLREASERIAGWVKDTVENFVGRILQNRNSEREDPGFER